MTSGIPQRDYKGPSELFRVCWILVLIALPAQAQLLPAGGVYERQSEPLSAALSPQMWTATEACIDRGLDWISKQQRRDGSFNDNARYMGQPGITSLAVMAFLSRGHRPGEGPYGEQLNRAIDFVIGCQRSDGLYSYEDPGPVHMNKHPSKAATYNHAIAGLMLTEAYGMTDSSRSLSIKESVEKALLFTRRLQTRPKPNPRDMGGWRYLHPVGGGNSDSDLSVTGWKLMFLRSAKNAGFDIPKEHIDEAMNYVHACWDEQRGIFYYTTQDSRWSRGMVGVGILSLSMAGQHQTPIARRAGNFLLANPITQYGQTAGSGGRFYYGCYYCSQAMAQLGGDYWKRFFPVMVQTLLNCQSRSGEWPPEPHSGDSVFGSVCSTSMAVLSLTPPLQLLPVYQR